MQILQKTIAPWLAQLLAVACVSLAAKVEETEVPLLLDLQVHFTLTRSILIHLSIITQEQFMCTLFSSLHKQVGHVPHVFEARTIQRMELLILSTLKWRLSSVTPFSFLGFLLQKMAICRRSYSDLLPRVEELILNSCGGRYNAIS